MRILLFGKNGQLGWELQRSLAPLGEVVALDLDGLPSLRGDFGEPESLAAIVRAVGPDVIVNAAAHTAVDKAEGEPELVRAINARAPGVLAREARARGAWLVHYSTDYVFDGSGDHARTEEAPASPLNVYGQSKLDGEEAVRASGCSQLLFRTSWLYSTRRSNFAKTMLLRASSEDVMQVVDDQIGAPTGADLLADITAHALRAVLATPALGGTYHAVAAGQTSRHEYASHVIARARAAGASIRVRPENILRVTSAAYRTPASRPANSRMDTKRLRDAFSLTLPPWQTGVDRMLEELIR